MRPIETKYQGYRFRSRLEARWAVLLDELSIKWEYEPEGFSLGSEPETIFYLPDFWIPELKCWLEIKGPAPSLQDKDKAGLLAMESEFPVIIQWGEIGEFADENSILFSGRLPPPPGTFSAVIWEWFFPDGGLGSLLQEKGYLVAYREDDAQWSVEKMIDTDLEYWKSRGVADVHPVWGNHRSFSSGGVNEFFRLVQKIRPYSEIIDAVSAARSARFEHGERKVRSRAFWSPASGLFGSVESIRKRLEDATSRVPYDPPEENLPEISSVRELGVEPENGKCVYCSENFWFIVPDRNLLVSAAGSAIQDGEDLENALIYTPGILKIARNSGYEDSELYVAKDGKWVMDSTFDPADYR